MLNYHIHNDSDISPTLDLEDNTFLDWIKESEQQEETDPYQEEVQLLQEAQNLQLVDDEEKRQMGRLKTLLIEDKEAGLHCLMEKYNLLFHQIAYNSVHNYDLARDAVIIAWEAIYRWLIATDPYEIARIDLLPYLCKIVSNKAKNVYKAERGQRLRERRLTRDIYLSSESLEDAIEREAKIQAVREAVAQLPQHYARVIQLRHSLEKEDKDSTLETNSEKYKYIASITGYSEVNVRTYELRARRKLKKLLAKL